jgi:hypothetical protein
MLTKDKGGLILPLCFVLLESVLFVLIQTLGGRVNEIISFSSVVAAAVFSLLFLSADGKSISTSSGLLFTVVSDLFLVIIKPQYKLVAMLFFSFAQLSYFVRLLYSDPDGRRRTRHCLIRMFASLIAIILTLLVLRDKADALSLVSMFYYANLIINVVYAFIHRRDSLIFAIGLVLFILCDTVVGLSVMDGMYFDFSEGSLIYSIIHADINLIWLFYVPSQTLIALSSFELLRKSKAEKQGAFNKKV